MLGSVFRKVAPALLLDFLITLDRSFLVTRHSSVRVSSYLFYVTLVGALAAVVVALH